MYIFFNFCYLANWKSADKELAIIISMRSKLFVFAVILEFRCIKFYRATFFIKISKKKMFIWFSSYMCITAFT